MKSAFFLTALLAMGLGSNAQKVGDKVIFIKFGDTANWIAKVRQVLSREDFSIRDDGSRDTLTIHLRELKTMAGFCRLQVVFSNDTARLRGVYGLKKVDDFGFTSSPKNYQPILYFKRSKLWPLMERVAKSLGGKMSFGRNRASLNCR